MTIQQHQIGTIMSTNHKTQRSVAIVGILRPVNSLDYFNFQYMPHYDADHSEYALMIRDRPPTTYFWQRNPTNLKVHQLAADPLQGSVFYTLSQLQSSVSEVS